MNKRNQKKHNRRVRNNAYILKSLTLSDLMKSYYNKAIEIGCTPHDSYTVCIMLCGMGNTMLSRERELSKGV